MEPKDPWDPKFPFSIEPFALVSLVGPIKFENQVSNISPNP
jgi:hypothetical protein